VSEKRKESSASSASLWCIFMKGRAVMTAFWDTPLRIFVGLREATPN